MYKLIAPGKLGKLSLCCVQIYVDTLHFSRGSNTSELIKITDLELGSNTLFCLLPTILWEEILIPQHTVTSGWKRWQNPDHREACKMREKNNTTFYFLSQHIKEDVRCARKYSRLRKKYRFYFQRFTRRLGSFGWVWTSGLELSSHMSSRVQLSQFPAYLSSA